MTWKGNLSKTKKHCSSLKSNVDFIQSVNMEGRGGRNCSFLYGKSILSTSYSLWPFINYFCHDIYSKMFKNTLFPSIRFPPLLSIPLSLHSAPIIIMIIMYNASAFSLHSFVNVRSVCECHWKSGNMTNFFPSNTPWYNFNKRRKFIRFPPSLQCHVSFTNGYNCHKCCC